MNKKKRIALFALDVFGGGPSGKEIPVLVDLFTRLSESFQIEVYSLTAIETPNLPKHIPIWQPVSKRLPGRINHLFVALRFVINQVIRPCDLIFAVSDYPAGSWAVKLGRIFRKPVIVQLIGFEAVALVDINYGNLTKPWLAKITRAVCDRADHVVMVADYQKKVAQQDLPTKRQIDVLPLRINPEKFPYTKHVIEGPVQFIHVAYYSALKDQDMMFHAFAKVAASIECHLTVVGDFYDVPKVQALLSDLGITHRVTFAGIVAQSELPKYFKRAHILLHPARFETGCAVIQEAMASGVAVCGTDVGILSDIGDAYAVIVPVGDSVLLAHKILALVNDPNAYREMTERAYQWISSFGAVWAYENYRRFIEVTLSERK